MTSKTNPAKKSLASLPKRTRPLSKTLQEFVESAIADTPDLTTEQIQLINARLLPLYAHFRPNPPFIVDALDTLGDTEEIRSSEIYFRQTLKDFITGWNTIDHVYYALSAVYIGFVNEYVRIGRENLRSNLPPEPLIAEHPYTQRLPATRRPEPTIPLPIPEPESAVTQIGLFM